MLAVRIDGRRHDGGDGCRASVDRVQAVRLDVIRKAGGAAYARNDDCVLPLDTEFGHETLERGKYGVVAATRAPADLLIAGEVLPSQRFQRQRHAGEARCASPCRWP